MIEGDVRDGAARAAALAGVDAVVHLAAIVGDPACARDPELSDDVNIGGSTALVADAEAAGVSRFVFASTCSNYGRMLDPTTPIAEDGELRPVSLYASQKVQIEQMLLALESDTLHPTCLRFATVYGAAPRMRFDLTVNEFTRDLWAGRDLEVFGEQFWRPYIHARDVAAAIRTVLDAPLEAVDREVYNVGRSSENYRKLDLVDKIREQVSAGEVRYVSRSDDPRDYKVSFEKIRVAAGLRDGDDSAGRHRRARARPRGRLVRRPVRPRLPQLMARVEAPPWRVPLADVVVSEDDLAAVADAYRSGWLSQGPRAREFEEAIESYTGAPHAVAVANCTAALHLIALAAGLGPGDEVIVPSLTFVATPNSVAYTGATPVFADVVSPTEPWLDPDSVAARITSRTRAIFCMQYGGHPGESLALRELAERHGLRLLEDSAHALGTRIGGEHAGTLGFAGAYSFFSNKNLAIGEGGMLVCHDDETAARVRLLRSHGMTSLSWQRHQGHAASYDVVALGHNFRIDEARSALGAEPARAARRRQPPPRRARRPLSQRCSPAPRD